MEQAKWTDEEYDAYIRSRLAIEAEQLDQEERLEEKYLKGIALGIEKGREEGEAIGEKKKAIAMAKSLLHQGIDLSVIAEASGLSLEELDDLKKTRLNLKTTA